MSLAVLALDGVFDTGLSSVCDTFAVADELAASTGLATRFAPRVVGIRRKVRTWHGLKVPVSPASAMKRPEIVIVPAAGAKTPGKLRAFLARSDVVEAYELLREWASAGAWVSAACTGTFVLAGSSLLDGGRATTTWWLAPTFRECFPKVELEDSRMVVESGRQVTAGAALAHFDLCLWWVRRRSPTLAALAARYLVIESRPSQALYAIADQLQHTDPVVERFEQWARKNLARPFSLSKAAREVATSERTLARRMHAVLGRTPLSYIQDLRVEAAVHRLRTSDASIEQIADEVGYANGVTLRTLLRRKTGRGVRELRSPI
jgi:transcriptional regulator GlxA family with amidase domain